MSKKAFAIGAFVLLLCSLSSVLIGYFEWYDKLQKKKAKQKEEEEKAGNFLPEYEGLLKARYVRIQTGDGLKPMIDFVDIIDPQRIPITSYTLSITDDVLEIDMGKDQKVDVVTVFAPEGLTAKLRGGNIKLVKDDGDVVVDETLEGMFRTYTYDDLTEDLKGNNNVRKLLGFRITDDQADVDRAYNESRDAFQAALGTEE